MKIIVDTDDLVTVADIAREAGAGRTAVWNWWSRRATTRFPDAIITAGSTRLWSRTAVTAWLASR